MKVRFPLWTSLFFLRPNKDDNQEQMDLHLHLPSRVQYLQDCDQILVADLCLIDQLICQEENALLSFEAICSIHKLMDEDDDGTVDMTETDEVRRPPL